MLRRAAVRAGETLLLTGASGGVGGTVIQLARTIGATPCAVAGAAKAADMRACGADHVISRYAPDLTGVLEALDIGAVDAVSGTRVPELMRLRRHGGRSFAAGAIAGPLVELDLRTRHTDESRG